MIFIFFFAENDVLRKTNRILSKGVFNDKESQKTLSSRGKPKEKSGKKSDPDHICHENLSSISWVLSIRKCSENFFA